MSFLCPRCGKRTNVIDSRQAPKGWRRRRECKKCGFRLTTFEVPDYALNSRDVSKVVMDLTREINRLLDEAMQ